MLENDKIKKINEIFKRNSCAQTESVYIEILQRMGGEKRLKVAFGLYEIALNLCKQNIIEQQPGIAEEDLKRKIFERFGYDTGRSTAKSNK